jgi:hypothetical protein
VMFATMPNVSVIIDLKAKSATPTVPLAEGPSLSFVYLSHSEFRSIFWLPSKQHAHNASLLGLATIPT